MAQRDKIDDSGGGQSEPLAHVEVLVIGAGLAGLSAAETALDAGADVLIIERMDFAGGSGTYAGAWLGVDTQWQEDLGIFDSIAQMEEDWPQITGGGDPSDPWVQKLFIDSAQTLRWLVDKGAEVLHVVHDSGAGEMSRIHIISDAVPPLIESLEDHTWLEIQAESLVMEDGVVIGAMVSDLATGESGWVRATSTIVATGGFALNLERVIEDRPELAGHTLTPEAAATTLGLGLPLWEDMDLEFQNVGNYGVYLHSTVDRRLGFEGEAVLLPWLQNSLIVDMDGNRVGNEEDVQGFQLVDALVQSPGQKLWGVSSYAIIEENTGFSLVFGRNQEGEPEPLDYDEMVETGMLEEGADISTLASLTGIDAAGLEATMTRYEELTLAGEDTDYGKRPDFLFPMGLGPYVASELTPGPAKAFVGVELDLEGRVLDRLGAPIPGLFAAGEAAGMLGSPAVGDGFTGSATAVVLTGLVAGQTAAERAQASP